MAKRLLNKYILLKLCHSCVCRNDTIRGISTGVKRFIPALMLIVLIILSGCSEETGILNSTYLPAPWKDISPFAEAEFESGDIAMSPNGSRYAVFATNEQKFLTVKANTGSTWNEIKRFTITEAYHLQMIADISGNIFIAFTDKYASSNIQFFAFYNNNWYSGTVSTYRTSDYQLLFGSDNKSYIIFMNIDKGNRLQSYVFNGDKWEDDGEINKSQVSNFFAGAGADGRLVVCYFPQDHGFSPCLSRGTGNGQWEFVEQIDFNVNYTGDVYFYVDFFKKYYYFLQVTDTSNSTAIYAYTKNNNKYESFGKVYDKVNGNEIVSASSFQSNTSLPLVLYAAPQGVDAKYFLASRFNVESWSEFFNDGIIANNSYSEIVGDKVRPTILLCDKGTKKPRIFEMNLYY